MTALDPEPEASTDSTTDALAERVLAAALGTADMFAIYLGDRLGWYRSLATDGPATPAQLAARTDTHERYAREWLEQQAVTGLLEVTEANERVYTIPLATAEVLTNERSLSYLAPMARTFVASAAHMPALLDAYRSGGGVSWSRLGADARESQADMNRPWYTDVLPVTLRGLSDVNTLLARPEARLLDVGCGGAWSSIALARAYPAARVDAVDIDPDTVAMARAHVAESGVDDRVTVSLADAEALPEDTYDVAFAFECVHDMPRPVDVLAAVRRSLRPGGVMIVMDEAVADSFTAPGDEVDRLMYGFSLLVCLPDGMAHPPSEGTGTVMRPDTLRSYAERAGFSTMDILPVEDFGFWRFYRLSA